MPATINQRVAASIDGDFVVFLIGARINKWWKPHRYIPVARAMRRMIAELQAHPEMGLLHVESWSGRTAIMVQYWRSFEHLHAYARARDAAHLPAQSRQRERRQPLRDAWARPTAVMLHFNPEYAGAYRDGRQR